jgi:hypothetical protein
MRCSLRTTPHIWWALVVRLMVRLTAIYKTWTRLHRHHEPDAACKLGSHYRLRTALAPNDPVRLVVRRGPHGSARLEINLHGERDVLPKNFRDCTLRYIRSARTAKVGCSPHRGKSSSGSSVCRRRAKMMVFSSTERMIELASLGPAGRSATVSRLFHFGLVFRAPRHRFLRRDQGLCHGTVLRTPPFGST